MQISFGRNKKKLLFEGKKHGKHDKYEWNDVVPTECFSLENRDDDGGEHGEWHGFLYDFQLDKVEWSPVDGCTDAVGRNHEWVLEQRDTPGE